MIKYMVKQLETDVIPKLEKVSGVKFDIDRLREYLAKSANAEDDLVWVLQRRKPSPRRSTPISAASTISARSSAPSAARTTPSTITVSCARRSSSASPKARARDARRRHGEERFRLVVEGPPNYTNFRQFWKMFYEEGAVVVASSYTKVGGTYDFGFRHDPSPAAGVARRILPQRLHQPEPADARRHARKLCRGL